MPSNEQRQAEAIEIDEQASREREEAAEQYEQILQNPEPGLERLVNDHEFINGEHIDMCLACEESWLYWSWDVELREDGIQIRRLSPVPPAIHPVTQEHVEECHDCYWAAVRAYDVATLELQRLAHASTGGEELAPLIGQSLSPIPPVLPVDHSWQELFGVNWVQPLTIHNLPWA